MHPYVHTKFTYNFMKQLLLANFSGSACDVIHCVVNRYFAINDGAIN